MVNIGTNYHLICSLSLKICVSSFRNPYLSDHHLFGSSEMKTIGPTRFVPPGPSLSSMSSQHFFTGRMHQIRAAHCVQHVLHRQIVECSNSTNILIPLGETLMDLIKVWIKCAWPYYYVWTALLYWVLAEHCKKW